MTQSCLGGQDNLLVDELSYLGRVTLGGGTTVLHNHINTLARLTGTTLMTGLLTPKHFSCFIIHGLCSCRKY